MATQRPTHEQIAARAYQIFIERGRLNGYDQDDWLQAEYELMQLPIRKIAEMEFEEPKKAKGKDKRKSIVDLVRAAMY